MIVNGHKIINLIKKGRLSLAEVRRLFGESGSAVVNVEQWGAYYNSENGELSEYCSIAQSSNGSAISAVRLLAYSSDGVTLYCAQYTGGFNSSSVWPSAGTSLIELESGDTILGVVFGSTVSGATYFYEQVITIVPVQADEQSLSSTQSQ